MHMSGSSEGYLCNTCRWTRKLLSVSLNFCLVFHKQVSQTKPKRFKINFCSSHSRTASSNQVPPTLLLNCTWVHSWEVKGGSLRLTFLLHILPSLRMNGAIASRPRYVSMICTGKPVIPYNYYNVICKNTLSYFQPHFIKIPNHYIFNYNGDRSECNRWFCV